MNKSNIVFQRVVAAIVLILGCTEVLRWCIPIPLLDQFIVSLAKLGLNSPLMLSATGLYLLISTLEHSSTAKLRRVSSLLIFFVAALASAILVEHIFSINLGIDFLRTPVAPTPETPNPGRVAPNTCLAFLFASVVMHLSNRAHRSDAQHRLMTVCVGIVMLIAATALIGFALDLSSLYQVARYNRMLPPTAVGLLLVSICLWFRLHQLFDLQDVSVSAFERRITRRSAGIMAALAISTGVAGFAILEAGVDSATTQNMLSTTVANGKIISAALDSQLLFAATLGTRLSIIDSLKTLAVDPHDTKALKTLRQIAASLPPQGVTSIRLSSATGSQLVEVGLPRAKPTSIALPLKAGGVSASLMWDHVYFLHTETTVFAEGKMIGTIDTEQSLPSVQTVIEALESKSKTTEVIICGRVASGGLCPPSRLYDKPRAISLQAHNTSIRSDTVPLVLNLPSLLRYKDIRGVPSIAAYAPLQNVGIMMTVKIDADSLTGPLREHVIELFGVIIALVCVGVVVARLQILPLLDRVVYEQTRKASILSGSNDAFIGLDADGRITDWNAKAEGMFHRSAEDAIGKYFDSMIVSLPHSPVQFKADGKHPVLPQQIEALALRQDGVLIPVELSVTGFHDGKSNIANAFVRDITMRKQIEERLAKNERFLRTITNNLPALVGYADMEERYQFANTGYQSMMGIDPHQIIGKTLTEVLGNTTRNAIDPYIEKVKSGVPVHFERVGVEPGRPQHFTTDYIPDIAPDGRVLGFFIHIIDSSERKKSQERLQQSEERLRLITDNLPVLISYLDKNRCFQFGNATFSSWLGIDPLLLPGKSLVDVIGKEAYEERQMYIDRAFTGETVHFDMTTVALGVRRVLQTVYVPHITSTGEVDGLYTISADVTALKDIEHELSLQARVDTLTGLPNRRQFDERIDEALARYERTNQPMAIMFLDVDKFKGINDSLGHAAGDEVLRQFAARLRQSVRKTDIVARYAGDEFVLIIDGYKSQNELVAIAKKILTAMRKPMEVVSMSLNVTTSIGITVLGINDKDAHLIIARADEALYAAKRAGRNRFHEWTTTSAAAVVS